MPNLPGEFGRALMGSTAYGGPGYDPVTGQPIAAPPPQPSPTGSPYAGPMVSRPTTQAEFDAYRAGSGRRQLQNVYANAGTSAVEGFGQWTKADDELMRLRNSGAPMNSAQTRRLLQMSGAKNDALAEKFGPTGKSIFNDKYMREYLTGGGGYTVGGHNIESKAPADAQQRWAARFDDPFPGPAGQPPGPLLLGPPPTAQSVPQKPLPAPPAQTRPVIDPSAQEVSPQQAALDAQIAGPINPNPTGVPNPPAAFPNPQISPYSPLPTPMLGPPLQMGPGKGGAPAGGFMGPQYGGFMGPQYGGFMGSQYGGFSPVNAYPSYGKYAAPPQQPSPASLPSGPYGKGGAAPTPESTTGSLPTGPYGKGGAAATPAATPDPATATPDGMDRYSGRFSGY